VCGAFGDSCMSFRPRNRESIPLVKPNRSVIVFQTLDAPISDQVFICQSLQPTREVPGVVLALLFRIVHTSFRRE
jgi:hypothetical protein